MNKIKAFIISKFLPAYAQSCVVDEIRRLEKEKEVLCDANKELKQYISGFQAALRLSRTAINIKAEGDIYELSRRT